MNIDTRILTKALRDSWSADTSYTPEQFSETNPSRGQCVILSLVVQDYLGGELVRVAADGDGIHEKHYYNLLADGTSIDTTRQQYDGMEVVLTPAPVDLKNKYGSVREKLLSDDETAQRYATLKERVSEFVEKTHGKS